MGLAESDDGGRTVWLGRLFEWCYGQSFASWCLISLGGNMASAAILIGACWVFARVFDRSRIFTKPQPLTVSDVGFTVGAIFFNAVVAVVGWVLWRHG